MTGLVVGVYLGCIALFTKISPFRGSVSVAAAVLAAAALFSPLRKRVQTVVDRRFNRPVTTLNGWLCSFPFSCAMRSISMC